MLIAVKRYLARIPRRKHFLIGVAIVFLAGGTCLLAAAFVLGPEHESLHQLVAGFGDAFIIAGVLAILVDPVVQEEFAREWGRDLYWAIFSPNAPDPFRYALQELAAPDCYIDKCTYILEFNRVEGNTDGLLNIDWKIGVSGVVVDRRGMKVSGRVFVVRRHDGTASSYTYWSFQSEDSDPVEFTGSELTSLGALRVDPSGRCVLDQSKIPGVERVAFDKKFWSHRHVGTTRWETDYIQLFQPRITLRQKVIVKGSAAVGLDFHVTQLGGSNAELKLTEEIRPGGAVEKRCELDTVAFPGQTTLLFWKPKEEPPAHPATPSPTTTSRNPPAA